MIPSSNRHDNPHPPPPLPPRSWSDEQPFHPPSVPISLLPRSSTYGPLPGWPPQNYGASPPPLPARVVDQPESNLPPTLQPGFFSPGPSATHSGFDLFFTTRGKPPSLPRQNLNAAYDVRREREIEITTAGFPYPGDLVRNDDTCSAATKPTLPPRPYDPASLPSAPRRPGFLTHPTTLPHLGDSDRSPSVPILPPRPPNDDDLRLRSRSIAFGEGTASLPSPTNATSPAPRPPTLPPKLPLSGYGNLPSSLIPTATPYTPTSASIPFAVPQTPIAFKDVWEAGIRAVGYEGDTPVVSRAPSFAGSLAQSDTQTISNPFVHSNPSSQSHVQRHHARSLSELQLQEVIRLSLEENKMAKSSNTVDVGAGLARALHGSLIVHPSGQTLRTQLNDEVAGQKEREEEERQIKAEDERKRMEEESERVARALAEEEERGRQKETERIRQEEEETRRRIEREMEEEKARLRLLEEERIRALAEQEWREEEEQQRLFEEEAERARQEQEREQQRLEELEREQLRKLEEEYELEMRRREEAERERERQLMEKVRKVGAEQRRREEEEQKARMEREKRDRELARTLEAEQERERQRKLEEYEMEKRRREEAELEKQRQLMDKADREQKQREIEKKREEEAKRARLEQERTDGEVARRLQEEPDFGELELEQQRQLELELEKEQRRRREAEQERERKLLEKAKKEDRPREQRERERNEKRARRDSEQQKRDELARSLQLELDKLGEVKVKESGKAEKERRKSSAATDGGTGAQLYQHYAQRAGEHTQGYGRARPKSSHGSASTTSSVLQSHRPKSSHGSVSSSSSSHMGAHPPLPTSHISSSTPGASSSSLSPSTLRQEQTGITPLAEPPPQYNDVFNGETTDVGNNHSTFHHPDRQTNSRPQSHQPRRQQQPNIEHSRPQSHLPQSHPHPQVQVPSPRPGRSSSAVAASALREQENLNMGRSSSLGSMPSRTGQPRVEDGDDMGEYDILKGVAYGFNPPSIRRTPPSASGFPRCSPFPEVITFGQAGAQVPPLHIMATSWKHLISVLAMQDQTRLEADLTTIANNKERDQCLRVVVQFVKLPYTANIWHTVIHLTLDAPLSPMVPNAHRYTNSDTTILPYGYTLLPPSSPHKLFLTPSPNTSEVYVIPLSATSPFPILPITLPNLALYLQSAMKDSIARKVQSDLTNSMRRLARFVGSFYPEEGGTDAGEGNAGGSGRVTDVFGGILGRVVGRRRRETEGETVDYSAVVTPFRYTPSG